MSNLEKHAEREMRAAGLYDADSSYGGMIPESVMKLIKALASERHSGGSHALTMSIFDRVANFKTLTPITSDPAEWMKIEDERLAPSQRPALWQNIRQSTCFSSDGGKTYYDIDMKGRPIKTALKPGEKPNNLDDLLKFSANVYVRRRDLFEMSKKDFHEYLEANLSDTVGLTLKDVDKAWDEVDRVPAKK